jgi:class 3 adenylate cyclase
MRGTAEWLASIGLSEYAQRFTENGIDLSTVRDLTEQDLKDLGVLLGHRRKMLRAIAQLDEGAPAPAESVIEPEPLDEAERRHLTVMFCDLVGSTALSARLDPEDMRTLIGEYHSRITEVISRYQGIIARYMGDGVLVYFGYPQVHEDDAEQAVRAGLALVDAVAKLPSDTDAALSARIGIATGVTVVGDLTGEGAAQERAAIGETPNLAARLQTLAEPGAVLICPTTRRLTGGTSIAAISGPRRLKAGRSQYQFGGC